MYVYSVIKPGFYVYTQTGDVFYAISVYEYLVIKPGFFVYTQTGDVFYVICVFSN